ncbi:hypothetical protein ACQPZF_10320 [Actinosynnema sp. CS-041913]|uniref:hypothetical protein n=1 Tax=Actinosynnema sp. CS-041913 TaxID=3239917 RepID=UPI003D90ED68
MSITLIPDGALAALLDHADQAREAAHALTPRARLLTAAYLLRDRFPNATIVLVDSTFHHIDPVGVEIDGIEDGDGNLLWGNGCPHSPDFPCRHCMQADLSYRTADDATWDDVVQQVATNLTKALCGDHPRDHWPQQTARSAIHRVSLPGTQAVAALEPGPHRRASLPGGGKAQRMMPGVASSGPASERHRLPLVLEERDDGRIRIFCDGRDCVWSWPLYPGASPYGNGQAIINAVRHALRRHGR